MRVLVTGGAGFIGSAVVEALAAAGHEVAVLDALLPAAHTGPPGYLSDLPADVVVGDVRDPEAVRAALVGVDAVCHCAAMVGLGVDLADLPAYVGCNDLGTAVLLSGMAAAGVRRLVLSSSMVVYGEGAYACAEHGPVRPGPRAETDLAAGQFEPRCPYDGAPLAPGTVDEDAPLDPRNGYAATKVAQEHLASAWARAAGGTAVALRYHNVYGPRMPRDTPYAGVAALFRSALAAGRAPAVFEDGGQRRDFVHVRDVARANLAALRALAGGPGVPGGVNGAGGAESAGGVGGAGSVGGVSGALPPGLSAYNIASGTPRTVGDLAAELARACGGPPPVVTGQFRLGDVRHVVASPARAAAVLGYRAEEEFAAGMVEFASAELRAPAS